MMILAEELKTKSREAVDRLRDKVNCLYYLSSNIDSETLELDRYILIGLLDELQDLVFQQKTIIKGVKPE